MAETLIRDIVYDKITLNQALTRAKLIAYKVDNHEFIKWINKELNGYELQDTFPEYRRLDCDIFAQVNHLYHGSRIVPVDLIELDKKMGGVIYKVNYLLSIPNIEQSTEKMKKLNEEYGYLEFPIDLVRTIASIVNRNDIYSIRRRVQVDQLHNILNMTKSKLLDALLELDKEFPNLEDRYMNNDENKEKVNNIVTNIYGDNASSNVGVGKDFSQNISNNYAESTEQVINNLRELGVPEEDLNDLRDIIDSEEDKSKLYSKFFAWSSALATKAIETGIDVKVPEVLDTLQTYFS